MAQWEDEVKLMSKAAEEMRLARRAIDRAISDLLLFLDPENLKLLLKADVARKQGVIEILIEDRKVVFVRKSHWQRKEAP